MILLSSFIFGLIFGSFLNVVIYRLNPALQPRRFSRGSDPKASELNGWVFGRSMCPGCKTILKWFDLIPVLSFIWLCGKCRYCREKISWQYPIVEIISAFLWVLIFYKFGISWDSVYYIFIFSALLVIAVYDAKHLIIPDKIVYPAIIAVFIYNAFNGKFTAPLIVATIAFLFFFFIYFFSKGNAMGLGDAKLGFLTGLFLNPLYSAIAFTLSFIIGAAFGIILIVSRKKSWRSQIAFGPFLVLGAFMAFFFSDFIAKLINF